MRNLFDSTFESDQPHT